MVADSLFHPELANGARCVMFTGTRSGVAGITFTHGCQNADGTPGGFIGSVPGAPGGVNRDQPLWWVFYVAPNGNVLQQTGVLTAWY